MLTNALKALVSMTLKKKKNSYWAPQFQSFRPPSPPISSAQLATAQPKDLTKTKIIKIIKKKKPIPIIPIVTNQTQK